MRASQQRSEAVIVAYLSVSWRDTTVCWQRQKTDYRFCQHVAVKEKVRWRMLVCLAKRSATITSFAGRVLSLVLGSVHQITKPWRAMSVFDLPNVWELWRPKKKKKSDSKASFVKNKPRTLFRPPVNRDGGLLRDWGGQLRSTLSNCECVVKGSRHPSCPLFSLVGAHRTCWPVLLDRGEVNATPSM